MRRNSELFPHVVLLDDGRDFAVLSPFARPYLIRLSGRSHPVRVALYSSPL